MKKNRYPAIPPSREKNPTLEKIREILEIGLGHRGNDLDQFVTRRDIEGGYQVQGARIIRNVSGGTTTPTTVGVLTDLVAMATFHFVVLSWGGTDQANYSFTEIWRADTDNLGEAVLVGTTGASVYSDLVGSGQTHYYWVRAVSTSGAEGPWNATPGTVATTPLDPDFLVGELTGQISESELAQDLLTPIQSIPGIQTDITEIDGTLLAHQNDIDALGASIGDNYALIQTKASTQVVTDLQGEVTDIKAQFTIKTDVNGHVAGIGLMNDGVTSEFIVASDSVYFIDPGQSITTFDPQANYTSLDALRDTQLVFGYAEVEGHKRFVINVPAYIPEQYVTNLMVANVAADKIYAASGTIAEVLIGAGEITDAMITNIIQSNNYSALSSGWIIYKTGYAEFNNVTVRGHIEADTGYIAGSVQVSGTAYDLAQIAAMAETGDTTLFQNWIRPGTTLIDGNKIYTGDAYVDTLQIKGQAVTFPRGVSSSSSTTASSTGSNVLGLFAPLTGAPVIITACVEVLSAPGSVSKSNGVLLSVRRGGTTVFGPVRVCNAYQDDTTESGPTYDWIGSGAVQFYLSSPSSGSYYIHVSSTGFSNVNIGVRSLTIMEAKR